jgi:hypothetical protein
VTVNWRPFLFTLRPACTGPAAVTNTACSLDVLSDALSVYPVVASAILSPALIVPVVVTASLGKALIGNYPQYQQEVDHLENEQTSHRRGTLRTLHNKPTRQRKHLIRRQRIIIRLRKRTLLQIRPQIRIMPRLRRQNTARSGQVRWVGDLLRRAQVCGGADAFEHACGGDERLDRGDSEGVGAFGDWFDAGGFEAGGEELDVCGLVGGDCLYLCKGQLGSG